VGNQSGSRTTYLLDRQLDPKVVTLGAVVYRGHRPGYLGTFRIVRRVVVAAIVGQLLHWRPVGSTRRPASAFTVVAPAVISPRSLPVPLDHAFRSNLHVIGVLAGGPAGAALAEEVPTLVKGDFDLVKPVDFLRRRFLPFMRPLEAVFLFAEPANAVHDVNVVHCFPF
jgi:hypothetical protein